MKKPLSNFKVITLDDKVYDMAFNSVFVHSFLIDSPNPRHYREVIDDKHGFIDTGTKYDGRTMKSVCTMKAADRYEYDVLRNEVFVIFDSRKPFYIVRDLEPGKRWLVKCADSFTLQKEFLHGKFEVPFISNNPYSESIGTTLDPITFRHEHKIKHLDLRLTERSYKSNNNTFLIYNSSDTIIDPTELPLKIVYKGASNNLKIENRTTGDLWQYNGSSTSEQEIVLDGIRSYKQGSSIFGETNRKLIKLAKGWNDFELSGTQGEFEISFEFRFYYL